MNTFKINQQVLHKFKDIPENIRSLPDKSIVSVAMTDNKNHPEGIISFARSAFTPDSLVLRNIYVTDPQKKDITAQKLVYNSIRCVFPSEKVKTAYFRLLGDPLEIRIISNSLLNTGCRELVDRGFTKSYFFSDIFDTIFMRSGVPQLSVMPQLKGLNTLPAETAKKHLDTLGVRDSFCDSDTINSDHSILYMLGATPGGAVISDKYSDNNILIDGIYINSNIDRKQPFLGLLAGALSSSGIGCSADSRFTFRMKNERDLNTLTKLLGDTTNSIGLREFVYYM